MTDKRRTGRTWMAVVFLFTIGCALSFTVPTRGQGPIPVGAAPGAPNSVASTPPGGQTVGQTTGAASEPSTEDMLFTALIKIPAPGTSSIEGKVLPLNDFLESSSHPQDRYRRAYSYWLVVEKLAIYNVWLSHAQDIDMCTAQRQNRGMTPASQAFWRAAQVLAVQRVKTAEFEFTNIQYRFLQSYFNFSTRLAQSHYFTEKDEQAKKQVLTNLLRIPAEIPTTKPYNTRAADINQTSRLSGTARTLDMTLPLQSEIVRLRMTEANKSYEALVGLFTSQNAEDDQLESALERTTKAKVAMVEAVIKYNQMIAAYVAETVAVRTRGNQLLATYNIPAKPELAAKTAMADTNNRANSRRIARGQSKSTFAPAKSNPARTATNTASIPSIPSSTGTRAIAPGMTGSGTSTPPVPSAGDQNRNGAAPVLPSGFPGSTSTDSSPWPDFPTPGVTPGTTSPQRPQTSPQTSPQPLTQPAFPSAPSSIPSPVPSPVPAAPEFPIIRGQMPNAPTDTPNRDTPAPNAPDDFPSLNMPDLPDLNGPSDIAAPNTESIPTPPANPGTPPATPENPMSTPPANPPANPLANPPANPMSPAPPTAPSPEASITPPTSGTPAPVPAAPIAAPAAVADPAPRVPSSETTKVTVTAEQQRQVRSVVQTLFPVEAGPSGAGDAAIIELPLSLHDAIAPMTDGPRRLEAVEAYWKLREKMAMLEVEKNSLELTERMFQTLSADAQRSGVAVPPELKALIDSFESETLAGKAREAALRIDIRYLQIELLQRLGRAPDNGWPVPTSLPYCGPAYRLESDNVQHDTFILATEAVFIPEKLQAAQNMALALSPPPYLLTPEIERIAQINDGWLYLRILRNKRESAKICIETFISLNRSIARYVTEYASNTTVSGTVFADSLIGPR